MGRSFGASEASFAGVRSPPLQERRCKVRWPRWGNPEMARKLVFSEGRGLRVRVARPTNAEAFHFHPLMREEAGWATGHMPRSNPCHPRGRAEPAPPRDGQAKARRPYGGKFGDDAKGGFLGGTHSVRPRCEAARRPRHLIPTTSVNDGPAPWRGYARVEPIPFPRACGARPSGRGDPK